MALDKLYLLCHSTKELKREGYVLRPLTEKELKTKMRCSLCNGECTIVANLRVTNRDSSAAKGPTATPQTSAKLLEKVFCRVRQLVQLIVSVHDTREEADTSQQAWCSSCFQNSSSTRAAEEDLLLASWQCQSLHKSE
jgi:hypothetical protein